MKQYDLLIKNGWIVDGSGAPRFRGDVGVCGDRITAVGQLDGDAQILIDANGKIVSPGFIDVHTHSDSSPFSSEECESKVQQGVTTEVTGNCGSSPFPAKGAADHRASTAAFLAGVAERGYASNLCALVGHGRLRGYVMGQALREPTEEEMQDERTKYILGL